MSRWGTEPTPLDDEGLEEELPEGEWELDPNDPTHPDHDLSLAHGYANWEPAPKMLLAQPGVVLVLTVVVIIALFVSLFWFVF